tara:strand:+ start:161 stop:454 length:294 start_codon:yes stop_codon:yes gene_type:complete
MSQQQTGNFTIAAGVIAIAIAFFAWFSTSSSTSTESIAENEVQTTQEEQKAIHIYGSDSPEQITEEIVVVADELVEKAQEAAERNQANTNAEVENEE